MKGRLCRSFALAIVILAVTVGLAAAKSHGSAPDNVPRFLEAIEKAGFSSQEGAFTFFDLINEVCAGEGYSSAMGNNPWPNAYFVLQMPNPEKANYELPFVMNW